MAFNYTLTTGSDTVAGTAGNDTVYATADTLNAGDSLTGGAGLDILSLSGTGTFRVDQLAAFTGFERIRVDNATSYGSGSTVALDSQAIQVDTTGYVTIQVNSASNWNGSNVINGDPSQTGIGTDLIFYNPGSYQGIYPLLPVTYDLTANTFSHVRNISVGSSVTLVINNADTAGVQSFSGFGPSPKLTTAGSTLDLSHTTVNGLSITSTNAPGHGLHGRRPRHGVSDCRRGRAGHHHRARLHLQRRSAQLYLRHRLGGEDCRSERNVYGATTLSRRCQSHHWHRHDCRTFVRLDCVRDGGDAERG